MQGFLPNKPAVLHPPAEIFPTACPARNKTTIHLGSLGQKLRPSNPNPGKKKKKTFKGCAVREEEQSCVFSEEQLLDRFSQSVSTVSLELPVWTSQALPQGEV